MFFNSKLERKFKEANKLLNQGKITKRVFCEMVNTLNFKHKNGHYYQIGYNGEWLVFDFSSNCWGNAENYIKKNVKRKKRFTLSAISIVLVIAILFLIPDSWSWIISRVINPDLSKVSSDIPIPQKEVYLTPAFEAELCPGIAVKAPEVALNEDEKFNAYFVDTDTASEKARQAEIPYPVLHAFEFDAGMSENESFNRAVSVEVDLEEADIPEELLKDVAVYRIGENGVQQLNFSIQNDVITIYTRKNSLIVMVGLPILISLTGVFLHQENSEKYGSQEYMAYRIPDPEYNGYTIYWPVNHKYNKPRDDSKLADIRRDINAVMKKTGLAWSESKRCFVQDPSSRRYFAHALMEAQSMPEYKRLEKQLYNPDFLLKYVYPEKVAMIVEYLIHAHNYLFKERGFMKVANGVYIVLRDPWPQNIDAGATGLSVDQMTKFPYILVNLPLMKTTQELEDELAPYIKRGSSRVNQMRSDNTAIRNGNLDSLQGTIVHELFHVVQEEYRNHIVSDNLHFLRGYGIAGGVRGCGILQKKGISFFKGLCIDR